MADLDLKELNRLEKKTLTGQVGFHPGLLHLTLAELETVGGQLRPLLDLVERMGKELQNLSWHLDPDDTCADTEFTGNPCAFADYRRAKGEK